MSGSCTVLQRSRAGQAASGRLAAAGARSKGVILVSLAAVALLGAMARPASALSPLNVYRFYNMNNGAHFYTASDAERVSLWSNLSHIYKYEGAIWAVDSDSPYAKQPLYRFYNLKNGAHFYTADEQEKYRILTQLSDTYSYDGVAYRVSTQPVSGGLTVYRFYYRPLGSHFYTADPAERDYIRLKLTTVYTYEGTAFHVPTAPRAGYDPAGACSYADRWSSNVPRLRNPAYDPGIANDCCNFVSQCLHDSSGGKKPYDVSGTTEAFQWWTKKTLLGWDSTLSWVNCSHFYNYLMENPAGVYLATWDWDPETGYPQPTDSTNRSFIGDVVFYDWDGTGSKDHVGILVGSGRDNISGITGDLTDQHNTDRRHAIWHLRPYNARYRDTRVTLVRPL